MTDFLYGTKQINCQALRTLHLSTESYKTSRPEHLVSFGVNSLFTNVHLEAEIQTIRLNLILIRKNTRI
jgi:hypothetical protein